MRMYVADVTECVSKTLVLCNTSYEKLNCVNAIACLTGNTPDDRHA